MRSLIGRGLLLLLSACVAVGFWNTAKPLPAGTHIAATPRRLADSAVEILADAGRSNVEMERELSQIGRAEQLIVLDRTPVPREIAQALLLRKHLRPHLTIVLLTSLDGSASRSDAVSDLQSLERAGIIVVRIKLDRLRDSNASYSGLWRILFGWWSDPFTEVDGTGSLRAGARALNFKSDARQLMVADDGAGGWVSFIGAAGAIPALILRGDPAHDIVASEFQLASWSTDDDRLPPVPPLSARGAGAIDARFVTEGAIGASLIDAIGDSGAGDRICLASRHLADRRLVAAIMAAAARGASVQLLLDREARPNQAVAGELAGAAKNIELRWSPPLHDTANSLMLVRRRTDLSIYLGAGTLTRRNLADLNLAAGVELRMPLRERAADVATEFFSRRWSMSAPYARFSDESAAAYWRYRFAEFTGLAGF